MIVRAARLHVTLLSAALLAGCAGSNAADDRPPVVPVSGTVTYKQQPVQGAAVVFVPQGHSNAAAGRTDANGRFRLQTFAPDDGAVPGEYKIVVRKDELPAGFQPSHDDSNEGRNDESELPAPRSLLPDRYTDAATSGLEARVRADEENEFSFELHD